MGEDTRAWPQGCPLRGMSEMDVRLDTLPGGGRTVRGGRGSSLAGNAQKRKKGVLFGEGGQGFTEKVVFKPDPWFSNQGFENLAAH